MCFDVKKLAKLSISQWAGFGFFFYINLFIYLFIFGCIGSSLLYAGFLQLHRTGATLCCGAKASYCGCGARALGVQLQ